VQDTVKSNRTKTRLNTSTHELNRWINKSQTDGNIESLAL